MSHGIYVRNAHTNVVHYAEPSPGTDALLERACNAVELLEPLQAGIYRSYTQKYEVTDDPGRYGICALCRKRLDFGWEPGGKSWASTR